MAQNKAHLYVLWGYFEIKDKTITHKINSVSISDAGIPFPLPFIPFLAVSVSSSWVLSIFFSVTHITSKVAVLCLSGSFTPTNLSTLSESLQLGIGWPLPMHTADWLTDWLKDRYLKRKLFNPNEHQSQSNNMCEILTEGSSKFFLPPNPSPPSWADFQAAQWKHTE